MAHVWLASIEPSNPIGISNQSFSTWAPVEMGATVRTVQQALLGNRGTVRTRPHSFRQLRWASHSPPTSAA